MSAALLGLAFRAHAPSPVAKLVLLKLVDCCRDDGRNIWPSNGTVARAAMCSERTVIRILRLFCAVGLLRRVRAGGAGRGSTSCYELDVTLLERLTRKSWGECFGETGLAETGADEEGGGAVGHELDAGQGEDSPAVAATDKGDRLSPFVPPRVTSATCKGDTAVSPNPLREPLIQRERAPARDGQEEAPEISSTELGGSPDGSGAEDAGDERAAALDAFRKAWPNAAFEGQARLESAWADLSFEDRGRALAMIPSYLEAARKAGRRHVCAGASYLEKRLWLYVDELRAEAAAAEHVVLARWSREWWGVLLARLAANGRAGIMMTMATDGRDWGCAARERDEARPELLRAFPHSGEVGRRWATWLAARGLRLPAFERETWLWLPAEFPPGEGDAEGLE